ncbi:TonB-dependent receptor [Aurantibacter crassamenti]|uniref:TonB-dependent receptor n=1 Tax=Aurantibacter crassamenti TaxID=1837375 RepID=UPI001939B05B|nr:TonB-dependent receptor [Aurantibacter crassamenti]MBM1104913.1 TonB-dependent receptor [Aurantibacter crassamenti]
MQKSLVFFFLFLCLQISVAQEVTILDSDTNEPLPNVAVFNLDHSKTTISDIDGKCDISLFDDNERIILKHLSYQVRRISKTHLGRKRNVIHLVMKAEQLEEVVMSVSKWEQQKKDIPHKTTSIDARQIAFVNPQTSADLLQSSGKVFVQKSQMGGGSPMIRGFATNRLLLSVDGVRMNNAIFRGGNVQNVISIDPYSVKNTEVIFGPGSVIYGSDAIGGVMNFYTKTPQFSTGDSLLITGNGNYRFASANTENTVHADVNIGKQKWAFLTSLTYNNFGDMKMGEHGPESYLRNSYVNRIEGQDVLLTNDEPQIQVPTGYNQINFMQKIEYKPNHNWDIKLGTHYSETSDYSRYDRLIRPSTDETGLRSSEWYYGPQKWFMGNLQVKQIGKGKFYNGLKLTTAYQHFEESRNDRNFQDVDLLSTQEKVDAFSLNIDFENKKIGNLRVYYGGEYVFNKVGSVGGQKNIETNTWVVAPSRYPDGASWQTLAGYVNGEYKAKPNFSVLTGLRYSHVWLHAIFDKTFYPFPFDEAKLDNGALTGSLGFSWFPKADLQLTLNGSTGFRSPNVDDIGKVFDSEPGSVVVPNLDLVPEYAYNAEFGVRKNFKDVIVLKAAAYYTYLVDALVRRDFEFNGQSQIMYNGELSNVQAIQNAAKAFVYGLELGFEAFLTDNLSLSSNLTWTDGVEEEPNGTETSARHVAPTFGDFHVLWKNQKLQTDLFLNFNGEISNANLASSEQSKSYMYALDLEGNPYAPSWYTLNTRTQYSLNNNWKFSLNLENITDQRYRTYSSGIVAPGRNLILGLGYSF